MSSRARWLLRFLSGFLQPRGLLGMPRFIPGRPEEPTAQIRCMWGFCTKNCDAFEEVLDAMTLSSLWLPMRVSDMGSEMFGALGIARAPE